MTKTRRATVMELQSLPSPSMQSALRQFEKQFTYPLSQAGRFSIEHAVDYCRFVQAMGPGRSFIVEKNGIIKAAIATSIRLLKISTGQYLQAAYICDLKTGPEANCGHSLLSAMEAAFIWCKPQAQAAYGVVMQGTAADPALYSGRLGIPHFSPVASVTVLQITLSGGSRVDTTDKAVIETTERASREQFGQIAGGYACQLGTPELRSQLAPVWLTSSGASGCLEDTRKAKRLISTDGNEILAAHLTNFAYTSATAACKMISAAAEKAKEKKFQSMFVCFPGEDRPEIFHKLTEAGIEALATGATVYGHGLEERQPWFIHSSEI